MTLMEFVSKNFNGNVTAFAEVNGLTRGTARRRIKEGNWIVINGDLYCRDRRLVDNCDSRVIVNDTATKMHRKLMRIGADVDTIEEMIIDMAFESGVYDDKRSFYTFVDGSTLLREPVCMAITKWSIKND